MADLTLNSQVNISARDFDGLRQAFFEYAQSQYSDIWTDYNQGSFAAAIAEIVAFLGDNLHYYIDRQTQDNFLSITNDRQAAIDLAALIDYFPANPSPASGQVTFTLNSSTFDYGTPILPGFQVSNGNGILFETVNSTLVTFGSTSATLDVLEGETVRESTAGIGPLAIGDGSPFQAYVLSRKNIVLSRTVDEINSEDELVVTVDGQLFTATNTLSTAQSSDKVYTIRTSDNGETTITFGNGEFGVIPGDGSVIEATYRVLADEDQRALQNYGNLNANTVATMISTRVGMLSVNNGSQMSGGSPKESIEEIKINAPASLSALNRAVSLSDFVILAKSVTGVSKAVSRAGEGNFDVVLHIAPDGGGLPSILLKNTVISFFDDKKMAKTTVFAKDPIYQTVQLNVKIFVEDTFKQSEVVNNVEAALENLFSFENMDFGRPVLLKSTGFDYDGFDLYEALEGVSGLSRVKIDKCTLKPVIYAIRESNLGNAHISVRSPVIRTPKRPHEYKIFMHGNKDFILQKAIVGNSLTLNDSTVSDDELDLTLESGTSTDTGSGFLQDSTKGLQPNIFNDQILIDSAGAQFLIVSNTEDTITVAAGTPTAGFYRVVENLDGYKLQPNSLRSEIFTITSNTHNSVTVTSGLSLVASAGDEYRIYRPETNAYGTNPISGKPPATTGSITSYIYSSGTLTVVTDSALAGSYADDAFNGYQFIITSGNAKYELATVIDYTGASGTFTLGSPRAINVEPANTDEYICSPKYKMGSDALVDDTGFAPTTTQFQASSLIGYGDDYFNGAIVTFLTGANAGKSRKVNDYTSSNGRFTVDTLSSAPVDEDEFEVSFNYEDDSEDIVFAAVADATTALNDEFIFRTSELVGDLIPSEIQILQLNVDSDLVLTAVGGTE